MVTLPYDLTGQFAAYFEAMHGKAPFRWQTMLMEQVEREGWPEVIDLPTASGKTACMDVALFALASESGTPRRMPRRIWFVVDRRIVVDEAYERAKRLAEKLQTATHDSAVLWKVRANLLSLAGWSADDKNAAAPVGVARLRGGVRRNVAWSQNPLQPAIITSTIDQLGSRLLFRGYGVSDRSKPMHAALTGNDSLIIVDEAHLAKPFVETVKAVKRFREKPWADEPLAQPFGLVVMSATPPNSDNAVGGQAIFPSAEQCGEALRDDLLQQRMNASKPAALTLAKQPRIKGKEEAFDQADDELAADAACRAWDYVQDGKQRVAVMVNRVITAQRVTQVLKKLVALEQAAKAGSTPAADVQLLTGRIRPVDRDDLVEEFSPLLKAGSTEKLPRPIIFVTTQCLEVGADFSFDALVTECASLDALRQRFGRLNRLGDPAHNPAPAAILARKKDIKPDDALNDDKPLDPIYGNALARTWNWLNRQGATVDMGIAALAPALQELTDDQRELLLGLTRQAPIMLPAYVDLWSQTNPRPTPDPDVALFLHGVPLPGEQLRAEVGVLWRHDLSYDLLEVTRPLAAETLTMPLRELRQALKGERMEAADDMELATEEADEQRSGGMANTAFVVWRGGNLIRSHLRDPDVLQPQDVVVLPATAQELLGKLCPGQADVPLDVYEWAYWQSKGACRLRYPLLFNDTAARAIAVQPPPEERPNGREVRQWWEAALQQWHEPEDRDGAEHRAWKRRALERMQRLHDEFLEQESEIVRQQRSIKWAAPERIETNEGPIVLLTQRLAKEPPDTWAFDSDYEAESASVSAAADEESLSSTKPNGIDRTLGGHTQQVVDAAASLTQLLDERFVGAVRIAAEWHDCGKADPRFQSYLAGQRMLGGACLLAKSGRSRSPADDRKLRAFFHVPKGFRHELLSVQLATKTLAAGEADVVLHLIAAHHGFCRPFAEYVEDPDLDGADQTIAARLAVQVAGVALTAEERRSTTAHRLDSGIAERFWRLTRRYGWWGLALLETLLRAADQHASAKGESQ